jgi:hypothetical protein
MSLPINWNDPEVKMALRLMGSKGGRSKSAAKREAAKANQKKAVEARRVKRLSQGAESKTWRVLAP